MADMIRACDNGAGVICLYGNYGGDKMNFQMACDEVEFDDIKTYQLIACDDIASAPKEDKDKRRGVAGLVYLYKVIGAAAEMGLSIEEIKRIGEKAIERVRTIGFAISPCIIPEVGKPSFSIAENEIEVGMGIHGESGIEVKKMMTANEVAEIAVKKLLGDLENVKNCKVSIMVNGLGATPLEEQYIVFNKISDLLKEKNIEIVSPHIGELATSMEMAGLSITVFVLDEELEKLLKETAKTPLYTNYNR